MELYYIWLECIKGLGPLGWHLLLEEIGNPYEIYRNRDSLIPQGRITEHCIRLIKEGAVRTAVQTVGDNRPVISGMAKGIDSYAHTAAINNGGYTIAVLGFGIDQCYPIEHRKLKEAIAEEGLLISEYPPGTKPSKFSFPRRNRIIAGLSDIIYVIDTGKNSGTASTVEAGEKYGKIIKKIDVPVKWEERKKR